MSRDDFFLFVFKRVFSVAMCKSAEGFCLKRIPSLSLRRGGEEYLEKLGLQRKTNDEVRFVCAGISHNLTKDWNRERIRNLDIFRCLQ